jgi:hypothetical protein
MDQEEYDEIMGVNSVCIGKNYLPYPTRLWYRSSNPCYQLPDTNVFVPYLNKEVSNQELRDIFAVFRKGHILQYPANRLKITKKLAYSRISKGYIKKKGWGTQSTTFTEPNINKLQRNNANIISNNATGEYFFPECFVPEKKLSSFPNYRTNGGSGSGSGSGSGVKPLNYPNKNTPSEPSNSYAFPINTQIVPENKLNTSIIEGGNMITCTTENICSGSITSIINNTTCVPTSHSDVPGPIIELCYPKNIPLSIYRKKTYASNDSKWQTNIPAYNTNNSINKKTINKISNITFM